MSPIRDLAVPAFALIMRGRTIRHLITRLVGYLAVLLLFAVALSFLMAAVYLAFAMVWPEPLAALATTGVLAVTGAILLIILQRRPRRPPPTMGGEALWLALGEAVRRNPWSAVVVAAALGALTELAGGPRKTPPRDD